MGGILGLIISGDSFRWLELEVILKNSLCKSFCPLVNVVASIEKLENVLNHCTLSIVQCPFDGDVRKSKTIFRFCFFFTSMKKQHFFSKKFVSRKKEEKSEMKRRNYETEFRP